MKKNFNPENSFALALEAAARPLVFNTKARKEADESTVDLAKEIVSVSSQNNKARRSRQAWIAKNIARKEAEEAQRIKDQEAYRQAMRDAWTPEAIAACA